MCIRDRSGVSTLFDPISTASTFRGPLARRPSIVEPLGITTPSCWLSCSPTASVSYTHLRAHETPEHLVCRLLLEKKKKRLKQLKDNILQNQIRNTKHTTN
eukprot:TRINITY_DN20950_c0_g1_i1.p1 TRINITY_DN20950_c0_g1~~TRINITY_DN20950_c0_g1_i1.p1  ORF type:complete len:101 (+),score=17.64 TRINITY_DN20950_c0_g1_i1:98-400(+)